MKRAQKLATARASLRTFAREDAALRAAHFAGDTDWAPIAAADLAHAASLASYVNDYGWRFVFDGDHETIRAAWLIAQHADDLPELQDQAARAWIANDRAPRWQAAYLEDRVAVRLRRPQRFGTQLTRDSEQRFVPFPLAVSTVAELDRLRTAFGLTPFGEYYESVAGVRWEGVSFELRDVA